MKKNPKDNKPKPGEPKPPESPKPTITESKVSTSLIDFSYQDLQFDAAFESNSRKYLRFFVHTKDPYFIDLYRGEYFDYQIAYFDLFQKAEDLKKECLCDSCTPKYEQIDSVKITLHPVETPDSNTKEDIEVDYPVYFIYELPENLKISIHEDSYNHSKEDNQD